MIACGVECMISKNHRLVRKQEKRQLVRYLTISKTLQL